MPAISRVMPSGIDTTCDVCEGQETAWPVRIIDDTAPCCVACEMRGLRESLADAVGMLAMSARMFRSDDDVDWAEWWGAYWRWRDGYRRPYRSPPVRAVEAG